MKQIMLDMRKNRHIKIKAGRKKKQIVSHYQPISELIGDVGPSYNNVNTNIVFLFKNFSGS